MDTLKAERDEAKQELREKSRSVEDAKKALSNLQKVLRDIGVDHESQIKSYETQVASLKSNIQVILKLYFGLFFILFVVI